MKRLITAMMASAMLLSLVMPGFGGANVVRAEGETGSAQAETEEAMTEAEDMAETEDAMMETEEMEDDGILGLGDQMPDFTVETTNGTFTLSEELEGKEAALIIFWATWCGPCVREFPYIQQIYEELGDKVAIVALSVEEEDTMEVIEEFQTEQGLSFPMGRDEMGLYDMAMQQYIPVPTVVDRFGTICFMEAGSLPSAENAFALVEAFLGDDYTESKLLTSLPPTKVPADVELPSEEELSAALNVEDGELVFTNDPNMYNWPFIPAEVDDMDAVVPMNAGVENSFATIAVSLTAEEGDAITFNVKTSMDMGNYLVVKDNGETIKCFAGERDWTVCVLPLEAGDHSIELEYQENYGSYMDPSATAAISAFRVLKGDEAADFLAEQPVYPVSEKNEIEIASDDVRLVNAFYQGEDLLGMPVAILDMDMIPMIIHLDQDTDPDGTLFVDYGTGFMAPISTLLNEDGTAYEYTADMEAGYGIADCSIEGYDFYEDMLVFDTEENLLDSLSYELAYYYGINVEDGDLELVPVEEAMETEAVYTIYVVDQNGDPVAGAAVNICTDETCAPMKTDEEGMIVYTGEPYAYHLQVLKVPEGYSFDKEMEIYTEAETSEITIEIVKE